MLSNLKNKFASPSARTVGAATLALSASFMPSAANDVYADEPGSVIGRPMTSLQEVYENYVIAESRILATAQDSVKDSNDIAIAVLMGDDVNYTAEEYAQALVKYLKRNEDPNFPIDVSYKAIERHEKGKLTAVAFYTQNRAYSAQGAIEGVKKADTVLQDMKPLSAIIPANTPEN